MKIRIPVFYDDFKKYARIAAEDALAETPFTRSERIEAEAVAVSDAVNELSTQHGVSFGPPGCIEIDTTSGTCQLFTKKNRPPALRTDAMPFAGE